MKNTIFTQLIVIIKTVFERVFLNQNRKNI